MKYLRFSSSSGGMYVLPEVKDVIYIGAEAKRSFTEFGGIEWIIRGINHESLHHVLNRRISVQISYQFDFFQNGLIKFKNGKATEESRMNWYGFANKLPIFLDQSINSSSLAELKNQANEGSS